MKTIEATLAEQPFFQGLDPRHLHVAAHGAVEDKFDVHVYIFNEGEKAGKFYVLRKGKVALEGVSPSDELVTIDTLEAGDILGWSWLLPPYSWQYSARVIEPVQVIVLDGVYLREKCEEDHDFGYELVKRVMQAIAQRLQTTRTQMLYGRPEQHIS
jgi:CRP/FNR family transcriptional regulator, cyclic AMP receptor protein